MSDFRFHFRADKSDFRPGESLEGSANWNFSAAPASLEIRLLWFTRGKGTSDASIVETTSIAHPAAMGDAPFRFVLPAAPHSFSGQLISLVWAVEIVAHKSKKREIGRERLEFRLSPSPDEIVLTRADKPMTPLEAKIAARVEKWKTKSAHSSDFR